MKKDEILSIVGIGRIRVVDPAKSDPRVMPKKVFMSNKVQPDRKLDCLGLYCPEPIFRTRMEFDKMRVVEILEVMADDPAAEPDINSLVKTGGYEVLDFRKDKEKIIFLIKKK